MVDHGLALVEDRSDPRTALDPTFGGEWPGVGIDPKACNVSIPPRFVAVDRHRGRGTATLEVDAPTHGRLRVIGTKRLRGAKRCAKPGSTTKLPVRPKGAARLRLRERGRVTVSARVKLAPRDGLPTTARKRVLVIVR